MKSLRERFEEEYAAVSEPADNKEGFRITYVYYAPWYIWDLPEKKLKEKKDRFLALSVLSFFLYLMAGIQDIQANRMGIPVLSGSLALCAQMLELFGVFRFRFTKYRAERMTYQSIHQILYFAPPVKAACMAVVLLSCVQEILTGALGRPQVTALLCEAAFIVISVGMFLDYRKIPFRTEKNEILQKEQKLL